DQAVDETRRIAGKENSISTNTKKVFQGQAESVHVENRKPDGSIGKITIGRSAKVAIVIAFLVLVFVGGGYYFINFKENVANGVTSPAEDINARETVSQLPTTTTGKQVVNKDSLLNTEPARLVNEISVFDPLVPKEINKGSEVGTPGSISKDIKDSTPSSSHVQPIQKLTIHFDRNSNFPVGEPIDKLNEFAEQVLQTSDAKVIVRGYTDSTGYEHYNIKLSEFRANNIKGYLVGRGIKAEQITTIGLGSKDPIAQNSQQKGTPANRRVEVEISD
ncbi:MAG: OmpA family protein, partial [Candidatus Margulisbacteria bacterium]|nr:OmpA family protein [Candidatus Margulisiibacteriota bacterium]